ncbi:hypothetical protein HDU76_007312 [Blyttiomyces sp. JEL0837]|nr:hypothetical protein HDU76_007312 [Blyttiomyces sp. JEL0837]
MIIPGGGGGRHKTTAPKPPKPDVQSDDTRKQGTHGAASDSPRHRHTDGQQAPPPPAAATSDNPPPQQQQQTNPPSVLPASSPTDNVPDTVVGNPSPSVVGVVDSSTPTGVATDTAQVVVVAPPPPVTTDPPIIISSVVPEVSGNIGGSSTTSPPLFLPPTQQPGAVVTSSIISQVSQAPSIVPVTSVKLVTAFNTTKGVISTSTTTQSLTTVNLSAVLVNGGNLTGTDAMSESVTASTGVVAANPTEGKAAGVGAGVPDATSINTMVVGIVVASIVAIVIVLSFCWWCARRGKHLLRKKLYGGNNGGGGGHGGGLAGIGNGNGGSSGNGASGIMVSTAGDDSLLRDGRRLSSVLRFEGNSNASNRALSSDDGRSVVGSDSGRRGRRLSRDDVANALRKMPGVEGMVSARPGGTRGPGNSKSPRAGQGQYARDPRSPHRSERAAARAGRGAGTGVGGSAVAGVVSPQRPGMAAQLATTGARNGAQQNGGGYGWIGQTPVSEGGSSDSAQLYGSETNISTYDSVTSLVQILPTSNNAGAAIGDPQQQPWLSSPSFAQAGMMSNGHYSPAMMPYGMMPPGFDERVRQQKNLNQAPSMYFMPPLPPHHFTPPFPIPMAPPVTQTHLYSAPSNFDYSMAVASATVSEAGKQQAPSQLGANQKRSGSTRGPSGKQASQQVTLVKDEKYEAYYSHGPRMNDEIPVNVGDVVLVKEIYEDGWAYGRNCRTEAIGMFPQAVLQQYCGPDNTLTSVRGKSLDRRRG